MIKKKYLIIFGLIILISGTLAVLWLSKKSPSDKQRALPVPPPKPRMKIEGLRFYGMKDGHKVLFIKADRLLLEKGKWGFFNIGLFNVVNIENGSIEIFAEEKDQAALPESDRSMLTKQERHRSQLKKGPVFHHLFLEETLSSFPVPLKNVTSIVIAPVSITFRQGDEELSRITAASAAMRLKKGDILLKGGVTVVSGARKLTSEQLEFLPAQAQLSTHEGFGFSVKRGLN